MHSLNLPTLERANVRVHCPVRNIYDITSSEREQESKQRHAGPRGWPGG